MALQDITQPIVILGAYVQNFACNFGMNSSPTTVNLTLIEPDPNGINAEDISWGATGFRVTGAQPGTPIAVNVGAFDYVGLVQSWEKSTSSAGKKISVNLVDPRILFEGTYVALNGQGLPTGVAKPANYFNIYDYYANPASADQNRVGMTFSKIRQFIEATGIIQAYNRKYKLRFSSGFLDSTGFAPATGIPVWYRLPATNMSFAQILNQVSNDFAFDYYAILTSGNYNPTGVSTIDIVDIPRKNQGPNSLSGYISGWVGSGLTTEWRYGQELITDPTSSVLLGPALTYWPNISSSDIECVWGYTVNQTPITTNLGATGNIPILLDHIVVSGRTPFTSEITVTELYLQKVTGVTAYPPQISRVFVNVDYPGYYATEEILRAASYGYEAWKSVLYQHNPAFAAELGIYRDPVFDNTGITQAANAMSIPYVRKIAINWRPAADFNVVDNYYIEDLAQAVHEATKNVAENYYGKEFLIRVGSSNWLAEGQYGSTEVVPQLEFTPVQYAWSEPNASPPSGSTINFPALQATSRQNFKDDDGNVTAFLGVPNYKTSVDANWPFPVDTAMLDRSSFLTDQNRLVIPVSVKVYDKVPSKAIVTLSTHLQAKPLPNTAGYMTNFVGFVTSGNFANPWLGPWYDFMRLKGITQDQIVNYDLMSLEGESNPYGLSPRRLGCFVPQSAGVHGFAVPVQSNLLNHVGFVATGTTQTPINIIEDSTLSPSTYGGINNMRNAASGIIGRTNNVSTYAEYGQVRVAGYPQFNFGQPIGFNNLITNMSLDIGIDGVATNYTVKTYNLPGIKLTKLLQNKQGFTGAFNNFDEKGASDLTKEVKKFMKEQREKENKERIAKAAAKAEDRNRQKNDVADTTAKNAIVGIRNVRNS